MKASGKGLQARLQKILPGTDNPSGRIFRNVLILLTGTGVAKAIGFLAVPFVTRLYTPEVFGLFSLFLSVVALLSPLLSLRYSAAIPLPKREETAKAVLLLSLLLLVLMTTLMAGLLLLFPERVLSIFSAEKLLPYSGLLLAYVFFAGLYEILSSWAIRRRAFRAIAKTSVTQAVAGGAGKVGFGFAGFSNSGLFLGQTLSQAAACLTLALQAWRDVSRIPGRLRRSLAVFTLRYYADFPRYRLPSQLLLAYSMQAPVLYIAAGFGHAAAGQLGLALNVLAWPLSLIGQSAGQAYYAEVARIGRGNPEEILRITKAIIGKLLLLGAVPAAILALGGQWIFPFAFGKEWLDAGRLASILSLYLFVQFAANPISNVLSVFNRQDLFLRLNMVRAVIMTALFLLSGYFGLNIFLTMAAYSVVLSLHYVFTCFQIIRVIRNAGRA